MPLSFTGPESFYSADEEAWWASVDKALKGVPRQKLFGSTEDGLDIAPLYTRREDTPARRLRTGNGTWTICQRIDIPDPAKANEQILEDLEGGADGIDLVFAGATGAGEAGIGVSDLAGLETLLNGVQLGLIRTRVNAGEGSCEALALLLAFLEKQNVEPATVQVSSGFDPFAWQTASASETFDAASALRQIVDVAVSASQSGVPLRALCADGQVWHNAGATPAQELGLVLASATAQLRSLEASELPPERWAEQVTLSLAADADQFGTIAKARAMRALWACVLEEAQLPQTTVELHMYSSRRMLTVRDPWVNLLRNTVAAFAAGVGGADSVCVLPHTLAVGLPDGLARRLARNTQSILLEESSLAKVMDPAAGSGAIEDRTDKLCAAAWAFFQEIETAGGLEHALQQGLVQNRIDAARSELGKNVARRKRPITGVSEFPNLSEAPVSVLENSLGETPGADVVAQENLPEAGNGARTKSLKGAALAGKSLPGVARQQNSDRSELKETRLAEPFENLRAAAERFEEKTSKAPTIFLATLGSLAQFTARATWTANAFAAGGVKSTDPATYQTLEELVSAFKDSGASLACLVSSDGVYETEAVPAATALRSAGARSLYLAGRPGDREQELTSAGVETFVYAGCDLLEVLGNAHARLAELEGLTPSDLEVLS
ncbi:methylmalonyl-CoA mutase family protein [Roseibium sp. MMSF_3544]|uniref:methylmalonyl-CoA mutase family protein n=1 Tax=unclassified Roseibium TaxID=2629323 RepID=UPI00273D9342|nr:methylmalonyl-CoA mutase family protein [Roseibium sp. MMSF_3544]